MDLEQLIIRQERIEDHSAVAKLIEAAFANEEYSDQREHLLVERLRKSTAFIPELSLVAEMGGKVVGHILLTKIRIVEGTLAFPSLALAPVSVDPAYQGQGIGAQLIQTAHKIATSLGHESIILLGHAGYYPRFGYRPAHLYDIKLPFEAPKENCMAIELLDQALDAVHGTVEYNPAFFE